MQYCVVQAAKVCKPMIKITEINRGHEQVVPGGASHPWLISRTMLIASWPAALSPVLSRRGKVCARTPSWSRMSYDRYMVWTALLT